MLHVKGHIISEGNLFDLNSSPKKQTKTRAKFGKYFVSLLEELRTMKISFEIY